MTQQNELNLFEDFQCRFFKKPGPQNTKAVMDIVALRAKELNIRTVLVATCSGNTAFVARELLGDEFTIIAVTHVTGFREADFQELSDIERKNLESIGVKVLTCQHAFGGVGRAIRNKLSTYQYDEIIAYTFRTFGEGTKVAVELALMAADAGLIRTDSEVISIGGSGKGADTALVLKPVNSFKLFDLKVCEVICKPVFR